MTLKTATLLSLIGMVLNLLTSLCYFVAQNIMQVAIPIQVHTALWLVQIILLNGSIILLLGVLYSKQKG